MPDSIQIGQPLPDLQVQASDGRSLALADLLSTPSTLLNFMHGTWCPDCVNQLRSLQRHQHTIAATGTRTIVIMADAPAHVAAFQLAAQSSVDYTVVADPAASTHHQIGVGDDTAMIVVDARHIVRHFAIWRDHRDHPGYQTILQTLHDLNTPNVP
ncbi:MAG: redoxin domain-containing protein [Chloroflexi bacterium]|nr:redoxin domain-containing protein [Chloroflexota bacterium]